MLTSWSDQRLALGDLPAFAVLGDGHLLVECGGQQRRQIFRGPAARVAGLALLKAGVLGRLAIVRRVFAFGFRHLALWEKTAHISSLSQIVNC